MFLIAVCVLILLHRQAIYSTHSPCSLNFSTYELIASVLWGGYNLNGNKCRALGDKGILAALEAAGVGTVPEALGHEGRP